jgi:PPOX class probable F420-dependent enzyme
LTPDLGRIRSFVERDSLAVVSTLRRDGAIHNSVVNVGVLPHPIRPIDVVGFVTYGRVKLANLRANPDLAVTLRSGWEWVSADGAAELIGPDDHRDGFDPDDLPQLLRDIFVAAGGTHDDWDEYDRVMREQRRVAVLMAPRRVYPN